MGEIMQASTKRYVAPFNGPLEIGLRTIVILNEVYPEAYSLERLVIFDYLVVHSDDIDGGPEGLHPQTPHRSGELLVRRNAIQKGLYLYMSRNLVERRYHSSGIVYTATEHTGAFLDTLEAEYTYALRDRAVWLVNRLGAMANTKLDEFISSHIDKWGAEFEMESILWSENGI
jgi:hypothetical protein